MVQELIVSVFACAIAGVSVCQPQAVIRVPQDAPTVQAGLDGAAGDVRIELAAGDYRELVVVRGVSPTIVPQADAGGRVTWSADLDEDGLADGVAISILGAADAMPVVRIEGIEFRAAGIEATFAALTIEGCWFRGGTINEPRAVTAWDSPVVIDACTFTDTISADAGGAVFVSTLTFSEPELHSLEVRDSTFDRCTALGKRFVNEGGGGGAIWSDFLSIERSTFRNCSAVFDGGAVFVHQLGSIEESDFIGNHSSGQGGAVAFRDIGFVGSIRRSAFRFNSVSGGWFSQGGAVYGTVRVADSVFEHNRAERAGGAAVLLNFPVGSGDGAIARSSFVGNATLAADGAGGAVCIEDGAATIVDSSFLRNESHMGGALVAGRAIVDVYGSVFVANRGSDGSAAHGLRSLQNCVFIANDGATLTPARYRNAVSHSVFLDNTGPAFVLNTAPDRPQAPPLPRSSVFGPGQSVLVDGKRPDIPLVACIGDPLLLGVGAIGLDPMFTRLPSDGGDGWGDDPLTPGIDESANDDLGDLTPRPGSPMIDAAPMPVDPPIAFPAIDLAGNPRVHDDPGVPTARPDIGPFEFQGTSCLPDMNDDGVVGSDDLNAWIDAFNARGARADQNRDGLCTPSDFNAWILNYNAGC